MKLFAFIITVVLVDFFCSSEAWWAGCPSTPTGWMTDYDKPFTFTCPRGQAMTEMHSIYSTCNRDRAFKFACRKTKAVRGRCHWSPWVNDWDKRVDYKCPSGFLTGIHSKHSNPHEDRRFKFHCCHRNRHHRYHCTTGSHFVNGWRQKMDFITASGDFLVGAKSDHDNGQEDRRWKFTYCKVKRRGRRNRRRRKGKKY